MPDPPVKVWLVLGMTTVNTQDIPRHEFCVAGLFKTHEAAAARAKQGVLEGENQGQPYDASRVALIDDRLGRKIYKWLVQIGVPEQARTGIIRALGRELCKLFPDQQLGADFVSLHQAGL